MAIKHKLNPCPFCGCPDVAICDDMCSHPYTGEDGIIAYALCLYDKCSARGPVVGDTELIADPDEAHRQAAELWNERRM